MLEIGLCDDEPVFRSALAEQISAVLEERALRYRIREFATGRALLDTSASFDLLFLDIQMRPIDGMQAAEILRSRGFRGLLIFLTVLRDPVFDAFALEAFDYLVKPLEPQRFEQTFNRALRALQPEDPICIRQGSAVQLIRPGELSYCEVLGRKIYLHRIEAPVLVYYDRLDHLEARLDSRFFRCHRSYLVNLDYVRQYAKGFVTLADGSRVPVARKREAIFMQALLGHIRVHSPVVFQNRREDFEKEKQNRKLEKGEDVLEETAFIH